jgi:hypothetical protein
MNSDDPSVLLLTMISIFVASGDDPYVGDWKHGYPGTIRY